MDKLCRVQILTQTETRLEYVKKASFVVGRADNADVVIADAAVSGGHFGVKVVEGEIYLADLDSRNGTWIGETKLEPHRLTPWTGETIHFGSKGTTVSLELVSAAAHATTSTTKLPPLPAPGVLKMPLPPPAPPMKAPIPAAIPPSFQKAETVTVALSEMNRVAPMPTPAPAAQMPAAPVRPVLSHPAPAHAAPIQAPPPQAVPVAPVTLQNMASNDELVRKKSEEMIAKVKADALRESEKMLAEAQLKAQQLKNDWERDHKNQVDLETKKLNDLKASAQKQADKILLDAKNEAGTLKKDAEKFATDLQLKSKAAADKMNAAASAEIEADLAEARKKSEKMIADANSKAREILASVEKQKKDIEALQKEAVKVTEAQKKTAETQAGEILKRAEAEATKLKDAATKSAKEEVARLLKTHESQKEKLADELEKIKTQVTALNADKTRLVTENKRIDDKIAASKAALKEADVEFTAAEKEYSEKIAAFDKKVKASSQAQLKTKMAESDEVRNVEQDLKNLRDQKEKLLKSIDDLKKTSAALESRKSEAHRRQDDAAESASETRGRRGFKIAASISLGLIVVGGATFTLWKHGVLPVNKQMWMVAFPRTVPVDSRALGAPHQDSKAAPVRAVAAAPTPAPAPVMDPDPAPIAAVPAPTASKKPVAAAAVVAPAAAAPAPMTAPKPKKVAAVEIQAPKKTVPKQAPPKPRKVEQDEPAAPVEPAPTRREPADPRERDMDQLKFSD